MTNNYTIYPLPTKVPKLKAACRLVIPFLCIFRNIKAKANTVRGKNGYILLHLNLFPSLSKNV